MPGDRVVRAGDDLSAAVFVQLVMTTWRHTYAVAKRRASLQAAVSGGTAALTAGACVVFAWAAVAGALEWSARWPVAGAAVAGVTLVGAFAGLFRRPSALAIAVALDAHAAGHDAIATALQLSAKNAHTPLEAQAISDADAAAQRARLSASFPWRVKRPLVLVAAASVLITAGVFVPSGWVAKSARLVGVNSGPPRVEVQRALDDAAAAERLIEAVQRPVSSTVAETAASAPSPDPLADLKEQLKQGEISPKELTQQAATAVERAADQLDRRADESQRAHELLRDRLAQAQRAAGGSPGGGSQAELTKALREGDLDRAVTEAERLTDAADKLTPEDRARLADELKRLADDVNRAPVPPAPVSAPPDPSATPATEATPQPEKRAEAERQPSQDLAKKLEEAAQGLQPTRPPVTPPRQQANQQEPTQGSAERQEQAAGRSPADAGAKPDKPEDVSKPAQRPDKTEKANGAPTPNGQTQPPPGRAPGPEPAKPESGRQQGEQGRAGQESRPSEPQRGPGNGASKPSESGDSPSQGRDQPKSTGAKGSPRPSSESTDKDHSADGPKARQEGSQPTDKPSESAGESNGAHGNSSKPADANPGTAKDGVPTPAADRPPSDAPSAKEGLQQLRDQLKKLAEQPRNARQDRQDAQKLREQAQKMWDSASPEQRKEMEQLARELAKERGSQGEQRADKGDRSSPPGAGPDGASDQQQPSAGGGAGDSLAGAGRGPGAGKPGDRPLANSGAASTGAVHDIDARSKGAAEAPSRVIAEWLTNKPAPGAEGAARSAPAEVDQAVRQAQQNAEQAVQQRTVPSRLSPLIRRYFDRLPNALGTQPASAGQGALPAPGVPAPPPPPAAAPETPKP